MKRPALFLLLVLLGGGATAQSSTAPYSDLNVPSVQALSAVHANFHYNCYSRWIEGSEQITRAGNVVTLALPIAMDPNIACFNPPPPVQASVYIGLFAAGNYTLVLQPIGPVPPWPDVDYSAISVPFKVLGDDPLYSNLQIFPNPAIAQQRVTARITARDFYAGCFVEQPSDIVQNAELITLSIRESELGQCLVGVPPPGPQIFDVEIGRFPPGNYTLDVQFLPDVSGGPALPMLSGNFSVGQIQAIPLLSTTLLAVLALGLVLLARWQGRLGES